MTSEDCGAVFLLASAWTLVGRPDGGRRASFLLVVVVVVAGGAVVVAVLLLLRRMCRTGLVGDSGESRITSSSSPSS